MLGGPVSQYTAWSGPQVGQSVTQTLDVNPEQNRLCNMTGVGMQCVGRTQEVTLKYKATQQVTNDAARALTVPHTPLKLDGIIGRKTAYLFRQVLDEFDRIFPSSALRDALNVWLRDPRSGKYDTLASLISSQPQFAVEVMHGVVQGVSTPTDVANTSTTNTTSSESSVPTTTTTPTHPNTSPGSNLSPPKKRFWTRRKKFAVASALAIAAGLLAFALLRPKTEQ